MAPQIPLPAPTPTEPVPSTWASFFIEARKDVYHLLTLFVVIAPFLIQMTPQWAEKIQKADEIAQEVLKQLPPPAPMAKVITYESKLQEAWAKNKDVDKLKLLKYLYARTQVEATSQWKDLDELYKSFRDEEVKLGLDKTLKELRAVTRTEWAKEIPEIPPQALNGSLRARIMDFLSRTNKVLDKLE